MGMWGSRTTCKLSVAIKSARTWMICARRNTDGDFNCGVYCGARVLIVLHLYGEGVMMEARYLMQMIGAVAVSTLITVWALMWVLQ